MFIFSELLGVGQHVLQYRAERGGDGDQRALHLPRHGGRHPLQGGQQHQDHQSGRYRSYRSGFQKQFFFVKVAPVFAPRISGVLSSYTPGDFVNLNCSTSNVRSQTQIYKLIIEKNSSSNQNHVSVFSSTQIEVGSQP